MDDVQLKRNHRDHRGSYGHGTWFSSNTSKKHGVKMNHGKYLFQTSAVQQSFNSSADKREIHSFFFIFGQNHAFLKLFSVKDFLPGKCFSRIPCLALFSRSQTTYQQLEVKLVSRNMAEIDSKAAKMCDLTRIFIGKLVFWSKLRLPKNWTC